MNTLASLSLFDLPADAVGPTTTVLAVPSSSFVLHLPASSLDAPAGAVVQLTPEQRVHLARTLGADVAAIVLRADAVHRLDAGSRP